MKTDRKKTRRRAPVDLRAVIMRRLRKIDMSPYRLSLDQTMVHPATARAYLRGNRDTTGRVIAELMMLVGLEVVESGN